MLITANSWHFAMQIGSKLHGIEMTTSPFLARVVLGTCPSEFGAGSFIIRVFDPDIDTLRCQLQFYAVDLPWTDDTQQLTVVPFRFR